MGFDGWGASYLLTMGVLQDLSAFIIEEKRGLAPHPSTDLLEIILGTPKSRASVAAVTCAAAPVRPYPHRHGEFDPVVAEAEVPH